MKFLSCEECEPFMESVMPKNGFLLEFGVYKANTLKRLADMARKVNNPFTKILGFDSWNGLPKEAPGLPSHPDWPEGAFSLINDFKLDGEKNAIKFVENHMNDYNDILELYSGFFDQTLTESLGKRLENSGSYIHIDCDLYLSSVTALNWLFKYRVPKVYSIIRYDDWISTAYNAGQRLAHRQIEQKYEIDFMQLSENVFMVRSY